MAVPSVNPIEIRVRDGIATLIASTMTIANGYYYNVGDINVYEYSNTDNWPKILIRIDEETNIDDEGNHPNFTHYTNKLMIEVKYSHKNDLKTREVDRDLVSAKLAHDLKKFFGDYYRLESYGCYQVRPTGYEVLHNSNETIPTGVKMTLECEYFQNRTTPTTG